MPDEQGNALQGEPGHWRTKKNKTITGSGKVTTIASIKGQEVPVSKEEVVSRKYSKSEAIELNRKAQEEILKLRKVDFSHKDREDHLVNKILKSNPK